MDIQELLNQVHETARLVAELSTTPRVTRRAEVRLKRRQTIRSLRIAACESIDLILEGLESGLQFDEQAFVPVEFRDHRFNNRLQVGGLYDNRHLPDA